jgi:hypothetical protein
MIDVEKEIEVGDYVYFEYSKNEEYPGIVRSIKGAKYKVEISTNMKKSEGNDLELVECTRKNLRHM